MAEPGAVGNSGMGEPTSGGYQLGEPTSGGNQLGEPTSGGYQLGEPTSGGNPMRSSVLVGILIVFCLFAIFSCSEDSGEQENSQTVQDSVPFMHSTGVSTLISDSGVIRYHLVAEEWDIFNNDSTPASWRFRKGMLMERYDQNFHIDLFVEADTAYLHEQRTWELRGRVRIRNIEGSVFLTEELFWDMTDHEMWNTTYMRIITPERTLHGTHFRSNEAMTKYSVLNSEGDFPIEDNGGAETSAPAENADSAKAEPNVMPSAPGKYDRIKQQK